jgi:hypothetical protein
MPIELGFILQRLAEMAERDESLRERQPWQAAAEQDYGWLGDVITKHYQGDDSGVKVLLGGIVQAFAGWSVEERPRGGRLPARRQAPDARAAIRRLRSSTSPSPTSSTTGR